MLNCKPYYAHVYGPQPREAVSYSEPGSGVVPLFTASYDKQGVLQIVEDGYHNLYDEIQSHRNATDINMIVDRYFSGDPTALSRVQGTYMDVSGLPDNIHDAMTLMDNARRDFDTLPPEIKANFDNDVNQFLAQLGTEDWFRAMQIATDAEPAEPAEPVKDGDING